MEEIKTVIFSGIVQVLIFSLVPFIWYLVGHRTVKGFLPWLGFKTKRPMPIKSIAVISLFFMVATFVPYMVMFKNGSINSTNLPFVTFKKYGFGFTYVFVLVFFSVVQTGLSEEIFFRGFLGKRLIGKLGFKIGNALQALIFAAIHLPAVKGALESMIVLVFTVGIAYVLGYLAEKKCDGSIVYGWIVHALVNIISGIYVSMYLFKL
ncbi:CPBP family intramembrane metalloprotease [Lagierella sp.]|uniref:CPBP family intramembrane glutamic endopeptidase n=1 Tax=Lagierella sp. TaxID=2849657 RepID=UPI0026336F1A|nr:CPBP family intramembrane metalloprotease [Lagierella sp.]